MSFFSPRIGGVLVVLLAVLTLAVVTWMRVRIGERDVSELEELSRRLGGRYVAFPGEWESIPPIAEAVEALETLRPPTRLRDVLELDFEDARLYAFEHVVHGLKGDPDHVRLGTHRLTLLYLLDRPTEGDWILVPRDLANSAEQLVRGGQSARSGSEVFDARWIARTADANALEPLLSPEARAALDPLASFTLESRGRYLLFMAPRGEGMTAAVEERIRQTRSLVRALPSPWPTLEPSSTPGPSRLTYDVGVDREAIREEARRSLRESQQGDSRQDP